MHASIHSAWKSAGTEGIHACIRRESQQLQRAGGDRCEGVTAVTRTCDSTRDLILDLAVSPSSSFTSSTTATVRPAPVIEQHAPP